MWLPGAPLKLQKITRFTSFQQIKHVALAVSAGLVWIAAPNLMAQSPTVVDSGMSASEGVHGAAPDRASGGEFDLAAVAHIPSGGLAFSSSLPDAPSTVKTAVSRPRMAPLFEKYIQPDQTAQPLGAGDKILFGLRQSPTLFVLATVTAAAGYEQVVNGSPNYGTDLGAYGQRVGAAALRNISQNIFSDSLLSTALHEDPRYYVLGKGHNPVVRAGYAISRVFVSKTDSGESTPNYALLGGYLGAAALTNAYYPPDNQGFTETMKSYGGSLGGAAASLVFREFLPDALHSVLRLRHQD
jgi:hypothetical protein